jgi:hypothetical protein
MVMPKMVAKLKMPAKKGPDPMLLMDEEEGSDAEEAAESPEEESAEGAASEEESAGPDLASVSDKDLVKEMEARGFSVKAPASEE